MLIYAQLALGATMRHQHRDLSILDFPTAYGQVIPDVSDREPCRDQSVARSPRALRGNRRTDLAADGASHCRRS